ncbi:hypothetical protein C8034_v001308 [Colletotrichum sidae]|uniref:Uncharacterized protein n=1 Tax=Colletotrichum sidae TaxID=1347389 RepID=A0A4V3I2X2_9PEZI|nr:hypothetical protein C8034_v001308 [Colletotrichum sidae]
MDPVFARFPDLPKELRLKIWGLVARAHRPGIHFFSVWQNELVEAEKKAVVAVSRPTPIPKLAIHTAQLERKGSLRNWVVKVLRRPKTKRAEIQHIPAKRLATPDSEPEAEPVPNPPLPDGLLYPFRGPVSQPPYLLAAPRTADADAEPSWTHDGNDSAYLVDAGLWTACRESRDVMQRRCDTHTWRLERNRRRGCWAFTGMPTTRDPEPECPAVTRFRHAGRDGALSVFPHRDLFLLDVAATQPWSADVWAKSAGSNNPNKTLLFWNLADGFQGVRHVAFEYDPSWLADDAAAGVNVVKMMRRRYRDDVFPNAGPRSWFVYLLAQVLSGAWAGELFLVDRSLSRIRDRPAETAPPPPPTFTDRVFLGKSQRYVELHDYDRPRGRDGPGVHALDFVDAISLEHEQWKIIVASTGIFQHGRADPEYEAPYENIKKYVRVLACEQGAVSQWEHEEPEPDVVPEAVPEEAPVEEPEYADSVSQGEEVELDVSEKENEPPSNCSNEDDFSQFSYYYNGANAFV